MHRSPARVIAAAIVAAFLLLRSVPAPAADGLFGSLFSDLNLVSAQQEAEISQQLAREIESKQRMMRDPEVEDYVQDLGNRLVGALRQPVFRYQFRVVADRAVNAFGIGGGRIYVNSGLLAVADSEGQVAAVLAHEIGHQVRRHVAKQISRPELRPSLSDLPMERLTLSIERPADLEQLVAHCALRWFPPKANRLVLHRVTELVRDVVQVIGFRGTD